MKELKKIRQYISFSTIGLSLFLIISSLQYSPQDNIEDHLWERIFKMILIIGIELIICMYIDIGRKFYKGIKGRTAKDWLQHTFLWIMSYGCLGMGILTTLIMFFVLMIFLSIEDSFTSVLAFVHSNLSFFPIFGLMGLVLGTGMFFFQPIIVRCTKHKQNEE
jgi:hypothetical protein